MSTATRDLAGLTARMAEIAPGLRVETGPGATGPYAYDASNYRVLPWAVAFPRTADDVVAVLRACREAGVPVTARGGGTSMAGNAVGLGVVLDFSRHMNRILDIDPEARTARVETGVVLDALRGATALHGLDFGPDPSSHSRCTLGGMIGNDACGNRSVRDGRTSGHVEALEIVTADGVRAVADRSGLHPVDPQDAGLVARLEADVRRLIADNLEPIRTELGRIPRQVSGYQLHRLLPENGFDMARALVGTEGTCAVVTAATVRLVATAQASALLTLGYDDVVDAAEDVPEILRFSPSAVEGMDEAIVATMRARRGPDSVTGLPEGRAWLYVELEGEDQAAVDGRAAELLDVLKAQGKLTGGRVVESPAERRSLWRVREDGAGLAARLVDGGESWPGWEDAAVAPENLAAYLRDFRKLLASHGLTGVLYGHFGAGCVHVRVDFDPATDTGRAVMRRFLSEAATLVVSHGGTLSGEHGDGRARSELLEVMYSHRMIRTFAAFKRIFDPDGLLNPGVIVDPAPLDADLALRELPLLDTSFTFPHDTDGFTGAVRRCVGIGRCRSDSGGVMCPSYRATGEENDSTRGRARMLQEMVRGEAVQDGWRSTEVKDALDLCLSCKACSSDCPVGVDMATYKAEFLHQHYKGRLRPRSHYSLGWLPRTSALAGYAARPVNLLLRGPLGRLLARLGGVTTKRRIPAFASRRALRKTLRAAKTPGPHEGPALRRQLHPRLPPPGRGSGEPGARRRRRSLHTTGRPVLRTDLGQHRAAVRGPQDHGPYGRPPRRRRRPADHRRRAQLRRRPQTRRARTARHRSRTARRGPRPHLHRRPHRPRGAGLDPATAARGRRPADPLPRVRHLQGSPPRRPAAPPRRTHGRRGRGLLRTRRELRLRGGALRHLDGRRGPGPQAPPRRPRRTTRRGRRLQLRHPDRPPRR